MARLPLRCGCGWSFFVPDSTPAATVNCPNCTEPVTIPGREDGTAPLTPAEIAESRMRLQKTFKSLFLVVVVLGLFGAAFVYFRGGEGVSEDPSSREAVVNSTTRPPQTAVRIPPPGNPPSPEPEKPDPPGNPPPPEPVAKPDSNDRIAGSIESGEIRARAAGLRNRAMRVPCLDVLHLQTGGALEGTIQDEKADPLVIDTETGLLEIPKRRVKRIDRGKGKGSEYLRRFEEAGGDSDELSLLMLWCRANGLLVQREYLCYKILLIEPDHPIARAELARFRERGKDPSKEE